MTAFQWFVFFLIVQVIHFLGTWKLYEAAGRKRWEAAIPVYNSIVLMKIIGRPTWWTLLLFIPIINLIMFPVIWVETLRSFGKRSSLDTFLGIVTFGFYIYYINYTQQLNYVSDRSLNAENKLRYCKFVAFCHYRGNICTYLCDSTFYNSYFIVGKIIIGW